MLATPPFHHRFHFGRQALLHYTDISVLFFGGGLVSVLTAACPVRDTRLSCIHSNTTFEMKQETSEIKANGYLHGHELTDIPVLNPCEWFGETWLIEIRGSYPPTQCPGMAGTQNPLVLTGAFSTSMPAAALSVICDKYLEPQKHQPELLSSGPFQNSSQASQEYSRIFCT